MIATETGHGSCLATLFFKGSVEALQICDTEQIFLPATEKAENLGFGVWLITSATTAYTLFESDTATTTSSGIIKYPGCRICIITLECGKQLVGPHIKIRSDLSTCEQLPAIKIKVKFPDPLQQLWSELPEVDDMPYYSTKSAAGIAMLKEVRENLLDSPKMRDPEKLLEIARPITSKMTQLRPSLSREFESHLSIKHSLVMSLISFLGSMILHMIFVFIYHRYKHKHNKTPLWCGLFCPKNSIAPGNEEKVKRTGSSVSLASNQTSAAARDMEEAVMTTIKKFASNMELSTVGKQPEVNSPCPSYALSQNDHSNYPPSLYHTAPRQVATASAPPTG